MAKKKAKKPAHKAKKPAKKARKLRPIKRSRPKPRTPEVVAPPMVDVTERVKQDVVEVKPAEPSKEQAPAVADLQQKEQEFQQELKAEPEKKGFWAKLFGKK